MSSSTNMTMMDEHVANETRGPVVLAVTLWMLGFSTIFVVLRTVSRLGIVKRWSWDDSFMILAWILAFGFSFSICWGVRNGLGRHEIYVLPEQEVPLRKSEYVFSVLYNPVLMATKTSILMFYLTLAQNQGIFKWATISTLVVVNIAGTALTILNVLQCRPVGAVFQSNVPQNAVCTDMVTIYLSSAPVNIVTDLAILILPFPVLTKMRLPKKQKIILIVTFSFGFFVAAVDIVRIAYLQQAFEVRLNEVGQHNLRSSNVHQSDDFSWYASLSFMWSAIEVHVGIICACVPSLKPLVARILPSMLRDMGNPHDNSATQNSNMCGMNYASNAGRSSPKSPTSPTSLTSPAKAHIPRPRRTPSEAILEETAEDDVSQSSSSSSSADGQHINGNAGNAQQEMDFMEFLTTPDMPHSPRDIERINTAGTNVTANSNVDSRRGSITFQDFYNLESKKPMTRLSARQSLGPVTVVTLLFFLWGFAYGLLDILNQQFAIVAQMSASQRSALHAAYFAAYIVGPPSIGRIVLLKIGFKATFMVGLCIYAVGTLIFWPSAVLGSFPAFIICNFVVGLGISILETGANPFVALCGPPRHAETRLNLSQGFQAIGTVVSPLLARRVFFTSTEGSSLINVQWAYLGISFFDVVLAVAFFYMPLPEATDEDFEKVAEKRESVNNAKIFGRVRVIYVTLALAVFAMFCYVGVQEGIAQYYQPYVRAISPTSAYDAFNWQTVGHAVFALGRFVVAAACFLITPRNVLLISFIAMIITSALMIRLDGNAGIAMIALYQFSQSGVFSLVYAISLRGLGSYTKRGSVWLTAAICGGAVFPKIMDPIAETHTIPYSMSTIVAASIAGTIYPIYLTANAKARKQVDPVFDRRRSSILPEVEDKNGGLVRRSWLNVKKKRWSESNGSGRRVEHVEEKELDNRRASVAT